MPYELDSFTYSLNCFLKPVNLGDSHYEQIVSKKASFEEENECKDEFNSVIEKESEKVNDSVYEDDYEENSQHYNKNEINNIIADSKDYENQRNNEIIVSKENEIKSNDMVDSFKENNDVIDSFKENNDVIDSFKENNDIGDSFKEYEPENNDIAPPIETKVVILEHISGKILIKPICVINIILKKKESIINDRSKNKTEAETSNNYEFSSESELVQPDIKVYKEESDKPSPFEYESIKPIQNCSKNRANLKNLPILNHKAHNKIEEEAKISSNKDHLRTFHEKNYHNFIENHSKVKLPTLSGAVSARENFSTYKDYGFLCDKGKSKQFKAIDETEKIIKVSHSEKNFYSLEKTLSKKTNPYDIKWIDRQLIGFFNVKITKSKTSAKKFKLSKVKQEKINSLYRK